MNSIKKLTFSSLVIAIYVLIMFLTQQFAYTHIQVRIATSLYSLSGLFPFLILPLGLANSLSNVLGGLGLYDIIGGFFVGIITSTFVYLIIRLKLNDLFIALPIIFGPGLIVPLWLSNIIHIPYWVLVFTLMIEQIIPGIVGVIVYKQIKKRFIKEEFKWLNVN